MILLKGKTVSKGIAVGRVFVYRAFSCDVHRAYFEEGFERENLLRFENARKIAEQELDAVVASFSAKDKEKAKIFEAHKEILYDEDIFERVKSEIYGNRTLPDYAVDMVFGEYIAIMKKVEDPLISERVDDLRDVRNRILRIIYGEKEKNVSCFTSEVIVVAHDLLPSDTATLDRSKVKGIITEVGGESSHTAIIARTYGIPAVICVNEAVRILKNDQLVVLDAAADDGVGIVGIDPDEKTVARYEEKRRTLTIN